MTLCASVLLADSLTESCSEDIYNAVAPRYQANVLLLLIGTITPISSSKPTLPARALAKSSPLFT